MNVETDRVLRFGAFCGEFCETEGINATEMVAILLRTAAELISALSYPHDKPAVIEGAVKFIRDVSAREAKNHLQ